jgi:hypothetical protein
MQEDEEQGFGHILTTIQATPIFHIITIFSVLIGLASAADSFSVPPAVYVTAILLVGFLSIGSLRTFLKRSRAKSFPKPSGCFDPFPSLANRRVWPRNEIADEIKQLITDNDKKHLLIVSPSGTGKSTLLTNILPGHFPDHQFVIFSEYAKIADKVLWEIGKRADSEEKRHNLQKLSRELKTAEGRSGDTYKSVTTQIIDAIGDQKLIFCFDQVERYYTDAENRARLDYAKYSEQINLVRAVLKGLATCPNTRTVFAIRSEYVFGSLSSLFSSSENGTDVDEQVEFYFLWGVNSNDDSAIFFEINSELMEKYGDETIGEKLIQLSSFDSPILANTFMLSLAGFVFFELLDRAGYRNRLLHTTVGGDDVIDVCLDAAFEGYLVEHISASRSEFDTVLYALACENKLVGQACDVQRLAGLSHYPVDDVKRITRYLKQIGIIVSANHEGAERFRIYHDRLADRILKSDRIDVHSRGVSGIRFLTENRVPTSSLSIPRAFPSALEIKDFLQVSYVAVFLFVVFGAFRLVFPNAVYSLLSPLYEFVTLLTGFQPHEYYREPLYYVPNFIAHIAWVSYIDRMNRSYVQYISGALGRSVGNSFSWIGSSLGIMVAFHPQLFVIPIVTVGFIFGLQLVVVSSGGRLAGEIASVTRDWGYRSMGNVIVVLVVGLAAWPLLEPNSIRAGGLGQYISQETFLLLTNTIGAALLLWFWQHIRGDQNNRRIWSANLALLDKGRTYARS